MDIRTMETMGYGVVSLKGDLGGIGDYRKLLDKASLLLDSGFSTIAIDLADTEFVSASLCGYLVSIIKKAGALGSQLAIVVKPESLVGRVLQCARLHEIAELFPSLESFALRYGDHQPLTFVQCLAA